MVPLFGEHHAGFWKQLCVSGGVVATSVAGGGASVIGAAAGTVGGAVVGAAEAGGAVVGGSVVVTVVVVDETVVDADRRTWAEARFACAESCPPPLHAVKMSRATAIDVVRVFTPAPPRRGQSTVELPPSEWRLRLLTPVPFEACVDRAVRPRSTWLRGGGR
jgi:hypothetical protein